MSAYVFDDSKAAGVCTRYQADVEPGNHSERNRRQRDVAGFWRVLNSVPAREKLAVHVMPEQRKETT